jgi:hypothetical protein
LPKFWKFCEREGNWELDERDGLEFAEAELEFPEEAEAVEEFAFAVGMMELGRIDG